MNKVIMFALVGIVICLLLAVFVPWARADIGPAWTNPAGAGIDPGDRLSTQVQMESEKVTIKIEPFERPVPNKYDDNPGYHMRGKVTAEFILKNHGSKEEAYDVWFPLAASVSNPVYLQEVNEEIQDFKVWVNNKPVKKLTRVQAPALGLPDQQSAWAKWPMSFKPGEKITVRVTYTIYPGGRRPFADIEYILQTGAGWKGKIGRAVIQILLPYEINPQNVTYGDPIYKGGDFFNKIKPTGYKVEGNALTWSFSELEPTAKHNIYVNAMEPSRWSALVKAREKVAKNPKDPQAQLKLAQEASQSVMILKSVIKYQGTQGIAAEATQAFRKALELAPQNVQIYTEFASWLIRYDGYDQIRSGKCPPELIEVVEKGLEKFPQDKELLQIVEVIENIASFFEVKLDCFD